MKQIIINTALMFMIGILFPINSVQAKTNIATIEESGKEIEYKAYDAAISKTELQSKEEIKIRESNQEEIDVTEEKTNTKESNTSELIVQTNDHPEGKTIYVTATAYTANCEGCIGVTYTGINLHHNPNQKVIAVDPNVIPLGSKVWVEGYGTAIAGDIGGAIKGNRIDVFIPNEAEAKRYGVKQVRVKILE